MSVKVSPKRIGKRAILQFLRGQGACYLGADSAVALGKNLQQMWDAATSTQLRWYLARLGPGYAAASVLAARLEGVIANSPGSSNSAAQHQAAQAIRSIIPVAPVPTVVLEQRAKAAAKRSRTSARRSKR